MADTSAYVHSNIGNATILAKASLIGQFDAAWNKSDSSNMMVTISKLEKIRDQLEAEANNFLTGYSIEAAQDIADNAGELLIFLANQVLYGPSAYQMAQILTKSQTINKKELEKRIDKNFKGKKNVLAKILRKTIEGNIGEEIKISEITSAIRKELNNGGGTVTVTEGGAYITALSGILDVKTINADFRKNTEIKVTDAIFSGSKNLTLKAEGAFNNMLKATFKSSDFAHLEDGESVIRAYCEKLGEKMKDLVPEKIPFTWGKDKAKIFKLIDKFIEDLTADLIKTIGKRNSLNDISNAIGETGEGIRESISRVAPNAILISLQMGDLTEDEGVDKINKSLAEKGIDRSISKMKSFHEVGKQSQTDLVLVNMKTGAIARAQSKNKFASYFTSNSSNSDVIENFRWKVESNANLMGFINNLSKTELGINLNDVDLSNISESLANSLWFQKYDSATLGGAAHVNFSGASAPDVTKEFEGAMEKLMAGQITNLLGVTLDPTGYNIEASASNMFYVLNGRMKKSSELVQQAIDQMNQNLIKTFSGDPNRLVNVTISSGGIPSPSSVGSPSFLPAKLTNTSVGYEMGSKILENLKVNVSLGTSIGSIATSALI